MKTHIADVTVVQTNTTLKLAKTRVAASEEEAARQMVINYSTNYVLNLISSSSSRLSRAAAP